MLLRDGASMNGNLEHELSYMHRVKIYMYTYMYMYIHM